MLLFWCLSMIQAFSISFSVKEVFHLFVDLKQAIVSVSGWLSPHNFEMFSISPQQSCAFRCWFSNNSVQFFFARMFSKLICGRSWHFLLHSFISIINLLFLSPGGSVLWFHEVSSHLIKFLFNSFSFQSECCPNYINLIPSPSSFNRSGFNIYLITKPSSSRNVPCSSFLTECFQLCSSSLYSFFQFVQPLKVLWFHSFVKEAT